jgi:4-hydroxy-3-polyprenylbenzoate decarboxylase
MGYRSLQACVEDLERHGHLVRIDHPVDPFLEAAAIHRRVYAAGGPALLFTRVKGCRFRLVSNLFGTPARTRFLFRDALASVSQLIALKMHPDEALKHPWRSLRAAGAALHMPPRYVRSGPVLDQSIEVGELPQLVSWPADGGPFVTLPAVYTEDVRRPGWQASNLGMYRIQLGGNAYAANREIGLHYQIHRGIGVHHALAQAAGRPLRVNVFVGGPPSMTFAAVMPLPEGLSELLFAGALGGRRIRLIRQREGLPIWADADFCISGEVDPERLLPEGPFGDHLGYYSLRHPFPVMRVLSVRCRRDAIWPFTVVGRPPQEDTGFGDLIHELTADAIPAELPGVRAVHAVDCAGVHPLLLAVGSERYMPFLERPQPQELLTQANAILGKGQLSLAKFLLIAADDAADPPDVHDPGRFLEHVLRRADWQRDLHFHTHTTIDTLDYSGTGLNAGSKVVIAAAGPRRFELASQTPAELRLPDGFRRPRVVLPGVLVVEGPSCPRPGFDYDRSVEARSSCRSEVEQAMRRLCESPDSREGLNAFRWVVVVDDAPFAAESLSNFLWTVFTRTNPADDLYGIEEFAQAKHWGCRGALVIDARVKPHHAPVLAEDPAVVERVEGWAQRGGPLAGLWKD